MRVVIYNSSSFGGCFDYGRALTNAYRQNSEIESIKWWIPENVQTNESDSEKVFITDKPKGNSKIFKQFHFLFRVLFNPIFLFLKLIKEKPSWVILNDFEQLSAFIWVPIFKVFLNKKHRFVVILHDPDRDAYPPSLSFTNFSMRQIISLVHVAIYHDFLPDKPYYQGFKNCIFLDLPHGFYPLPKPDAELFQKLSSLEEEGKVIMAILGNIRPEKNYNLAIEALAQLPNHYLIIAGSTANGRVNLQTYRDLAKNLNVENRLVWIEKFLTEAEMSAIIEITDVILLNYAVSFTSQSGILNVVAPFRKELIVSDGPSSLASIIRRFKVGELVQPGSTTSLVSGLEKLQEEEVELRQNWEDYLTYASWENHVSNAVACFKKIETN
jgi:glycosyltransferase involved in cell wall biosynthesis